MPSANPGRPKGGNKAGAGGGGGKDAKNIVLYLPGDDLSINLGDGDGAVPVSVESEREYIWGIPGVTRFKDAPVNLETVWQRKNALETNCGKILQDVLFPTSTSSSSSTTAVSTSTTARGASPAPSLISPHKDVGRAGALSSASVTSPSPTRSSPDKDSKSKRGEVTTTSVEKTTRTVGFDMSTPTSPGTLGTSPTIGMGGFGSPSSPVC